MYISNCLSLTLLLLLSAVQTKASATQVYPSEYAYHTDSVYSTERTSANCRNYQSGLGHNAGSEKYIHCDGTQLRLTDSDYGSEQYTPSSEYYIWPNDERSDQLLFIFPTTVNLTTITLHYYHTSGRGLPRLRFYAVPDDFDVWDAPTASYSQVDVAAMPPSGEAAGHRNISISFDDVDFSTTKILLFKFSSSYPFQLSEVEFIRSFCSSQPVSTSTMRVPTKASVYLTTLYATSTFGTIELESRNTATFSDTREKINPTMTATKYFVKNNSNNNALLSAWIGTGVVTAILTILVAIIVAVIALALFKRKSPQRKTECDSSYSTLHREGTQQLQPQSLHTLNDLYDRIELSPSTGQTEFISKTETDNTNDLSPHQCQHSINPNVDMQQPKSATVQITAASSQNIQSDKSESTLEQPTYAVVNKKKKKTGKELETANCPFETITAKNLSSTTAETIASVHIFDENIVDKDVMQTNVIKGNQLKCNQDTQDTSEHTTLQTDGSPEELYTAVRRKTKESTAHNEEELPPISPQGVEQLYTAVNKKTQPTTAKFNDEVESPPIPPHTVEQLYTAVMKKPKAKETVDEVEAPPVPPHTVEELYTAVQKNKKYVYCKAQN